MTAADTVKVPRRFNGPPDNGQGGYVAGVVAGLLGGRAEVSLRRPVPLETDLAVVREGGDSVRLLDDGDTVAEGRAVDPIDAELPEPVAPEEARDASSRYRGDRDGLFSHCFVCGLARDDAFGVFAGEVEGRDAVASPWTPPAWAAGEDGTVRPEFVWAALDCPTYFAVHIGQDLRLSFLARLAAAVTGPVRAGVEHVVMAWPIATDGRKRHAGCAVLTAEGEPLATGRALMVEPRA